MTGSKVVDCTSLIAIQLDFVENGDCSDAIYQYHANAIHGDEETPRMASLQGFDFIRPGLYVDGQIAACISRYFRIHVHRDGF